MSDKGNTWIWDSVKTTDPSQTKQVNQRGGYTSIRPIYQIERATALFGPIGEGWGYDVAHSTLQAGEQILAVADVVLWRRGGDGERCSHGPMRTMCPILSGGRVDDDAAKKALTDGLTKLLSQLGFSADVHAGRFDDHKYVEGLRNGNGSSGRPAPAQDPDDWLAHFEEILNQKDVSKEAAGDFCRYHYRVNHPAKLNPGGRKALEAWAAFGGPPLDQFDIQSLAVTEPEVLHG